MAYFNSFIPILKMMYPKHLLWHQTREEKKIYLTFDDGPVPVITEFVIDELNKYGIKATFFCVGENIDKYPQVFEKILQAGHSVGNHTYNHLKGWDWENVNYLSNIEKCDIAIAKQGIKSNLFRPPYGKAKRSQIDALKDDFQIVMWDVITGDFDARNTPENCLKEAIHHTQNGSIVIFHDSIKAERNLRYALPKYIEYWQSQGYEFGVF